MTQSTTRSGTSEKFPGAEPLAGYRLLKPLGRGGFGEVWKCEAPGGLHKAIKFVAGGGEQFRQELAAYEQVKAIRHPYLLSLERVELVEGELVMVMELADGQILDRLRQCQSDGLRGIPRKELIGYLEEAAEALDMLSQRYGLQHLDVKPENLLLLSGHVKVADYGLVRRKKPDRGEAESNHGFTPRYSAPEVLSGKIDTRSDQYSLALVFVELLTGRLPFSGQSPQQLMMQHISAIPDLSLLPSVDRDAVYRSLAKDPSERFPSCLAFIDAISGDGRSEKREDWESSAAMTTRPTLHDDSTDATVPNRPMVQLSQTPLPVVTEEEVRTSEQARRGRRIVSSRELDPTPNSITPLEPILSLDRLHGMPPAMSRPPALQAKEMIVAVVEAAAEASPQFVQSENLPKDSISCRFLSILPSALVPYKLAVVGERWGMSVDDRDFTQVVLRWETAIPLRTTKSDPRSSTLRQRCGFEIVVHRPVAPSVEYVVDAFSFGPVDEEVQIASGIDLPAIVEQIRAQLQNLEERRVFRRFPTTFPIQVYPQYSDGIVGQPISGYCQDISLGGVRFFTPSPVRTKVMYLEFKEIESVTGHAVLVSALRTYSAPGGDGSITVGQFQTRISLTD